MHGWSDDEASPVSDFVEAHVHTLATWDLLIFFHTHPDTDLHAEDVARRIGRRALDLEPEIDLLCRDGVLSRRGEMIWYHPDPELRQAIEAFAAACRERGRRMEFIAQVLR